MKLFWGYHLFCFYYNTFTGVIIKGTLHLGVRYHTPLGVATIFFPVDGKCQNWPFFHVVIPHNYRVMKIAYFSFLSVDCCYLSIRMTLHD